MPLSSVLLQRVGNARLYPARAEHGKTEITGDPVCRCEIHAEILITQQVRIVSYVLHTLTLIRFPDQRSGERADFVVLQKIYHKTDTVQLAELCADEQRLVYGDAVKNRKLFRVVFYNIEGVRAERVNDFPCHCGTHTLDDTAAEVAAYLLRRARQLSLAGDSLELLAVLGACDIIAAQYQGLALDYITEIADHCFRRAVYIHCDDNIAVFRIFIYYLFSHSAYRYVFFRCLRHVLTFLFSTHLLSSHRQAL